MREVYIVGKEGKDYAVNVFDRIADKLSMVCLGAILPAAYLADYEKKADYKIIYKNL